MVRLVRLVAAPFHGHFLRRPRLVGGWSEVGRRLVGGWLLARRPDRANRTVQTAPAVASSPGGRPGPKSLPPCHWATTPRSRIRGVQARAKSFSDRRHGSAAPAPPDKGTQNPPPSLSIRDHVYQKSRALNRQSSKKYSIRIGFPSIHQYNPPLIVEIDHGNKRQKVLGLFP